jgi:hypothetical protein
MFFIHTNRRDWEVFESLGLIQRHHKLIFVTLKTTDCYQGASMAVFTKRFADADEYEEWLQKASGRVNVLSINKAPTIFGSSSIPAAGPVVLKYHTTDKSLAPVKNATAKTMEYAIVGAAFFALFAYLITEL